MRNSEVSRKLRTGEFPSRADINTQFNLIADLNHVSNNQYNEE